MECQEGGTQDKMGRSENFDRLQSVEGNCQEKP